MNSQHFVFAVVVFMGVELAHSQGFNITPTSGRRGPFNATGPNGKPGDADDYDGTPEPDLRGPDGEPGTKDDWIVYFWGTEEGSAGCFTNDEVNCAGATGSKSAKWSLEQVFDFGNCVVRSTLTNTTDEPDPRCPNPGCIFSWSSPGLPNLEKMCWQR